MSAITRGEIYLADFGAIATLPSGDASIEIAKRRPFIVVSIDALNRVSERKPFYVLVVPGTTGVSSFRAFPSNVRLLPKESGLRDEGVFLAHQLKSVDVRRLSLKPIGRVTGSAMDRVDSAVRYVLGLRGP